MKPFHCTIFSFLLFILLTACESTQMVRTRKPTVPVQLLVPERVLLINAADIAGQKYRDGKEELFNQILDKTLLDMAREIKQRSNVESVVRQGFLDTGKTALHRDSVIQQLMAEAAVSDAVVIQSFDTYFYKHDVEVVENPDGSKSREMKFDLESEIRYLWFAKSGLQHDDNIHVSRYHSSRSVVSGVLAAGPNIVTQQSDAYGITEENLIKYLNRYLPGYEFRSRNLYTGGDFKAMKKAYDSQNFDQALAECRKLVNHPNARIAARANFNCAVLCESLGQYDQVKQYLTESNRLNPNFETTLMLDDY
jgi:hypothetical protein